MIIELDDYNNAALAKSLEENYLNNSRCLGRSIWYETKRFCYFIIGTYGNAIKKISKKLKVQKGEHLFTKSYDVYSLLRLWNSENAG